MLKFFNPMNIRISNVAWRHKDVPSRNSQFETWPTAEDGLHAGMENVLHAQTLHGCKSIGTIISRLSPPSENNTNSYIDGVCDACGMQPDEDYDITVPENLVDICKAIVERENGEQPYSDALYLKIANGLTE